MALEGVRGRRRALLAGVVLGLAWVAPTGCSVFDQPDPEPLPSIRTDDPEMDIQGWRARLSPEDRAVFDAELMWRKDLVIHLIPGNLSEEDSRGGASSLASTDFSKKHCRDHPEVEEIPWGRNWDLVYDRQLAEAWAKKYGIPNPIDAILYHELFGHILLLLREPERIRPLDKDEQLKEVFENGARLIENQYRKQQGVREVPAYLRRPSKQ